MGGKRGAGDEDDERMWRQWLGKDAGARTEAEEWADTSSRGPTGGKGGWRGGRARSNPPAPAASRSHSPSSASGQRQPSLVEAPEWGTTRRRGPANDAKGGRRGRREWPDVPALEPSSSRSLAGGGKGGWRGREEWSDAPASESSSSRNRASVGEGGWRGRGEWADSLAPEDSSSRNRASRGKGGWRGGRGWSDAPDAAASSSRSYRGGGKGGWHGRREWSDVQAPEDSSNGGSHASAGKGGWPGGKQWPPEARAASSSSPSGASAGVQRQPTWHRAPRGPTEASGGGPASDGEGGEAAAGQGARRAGRPRRGVRDDGTDRRRRAAREAFEEGRSPSARREDEGLTSKEKFARRRAEWGSMRRRGELMKHGTDLVLRRESRQQWRRQEEQRDTEAHLDELKEAGDSQRIAELADQLESGAWLYAVSCLLELGQLRTAFTIVCRSADSVNMSAWCRAAVGVGEAALSVDEDAAELVFPERGLAEEVEQLLIERRCDTAVVELWLVFAAAEAHIGAARLKRARLEKDRGESSESSDDAWESAAGSTASETHSAGCETVEGDAACSPRQDEGEGSEHSRGADVHAAQKVPEPAIGGDISERTGRSGEEAADAVRVFASESLRKCFKHIGEIESKVTACKLPSGGVRRWNDLLRCVGKHRHMPSTFEVLDAIDRLGVQKNDFTYEMISRAGCLSVTRPVTVDSFETMPPAHFPEIVFLGRSNVGKSSLVNAVLHRRKTLAPVAATPGHTTRFHFYTLNEKDALFPQMTVVDVPGLGFAVADEAQVEHWKSTLFTYMQHRGERLRGIFHLVGANDFWRSGRLDRLDVDIMKAAQRAGAEYTLVLTKFDMVPRSADLIAMLEEWLEGNGLLVDRRNIVLSSVRSRLGRDLLWKQLWSCVDPENPRWHGAPDLLTIKSDLETLARSPDRAAAAAAVVARMEGLDEDSWEYAVRVLLQLGELETAWRAVERRTSDIRDPEAAAFFPQKRAALAVGVAAYAADGAELANRSLGEQILACLVERGSHDAAVELLLERAAAEARLAALARTRRLAARGGASPVTAAEGAPSTLRQPPADAGAWGGAVGAADAGAWGSEYEAASEGQASGNEEGEGEQDPDVMFEVALESLQHLLASVEEWHTRPWSVDRWNRLVRWIMERRDLSSLLAVLDAMESLAVRQNAETHAHIAAGAVAAVSAGEEASTVEELAALSIGAPAGPAGVALPEVLFISSSGAAYNTEPLVDSLLLPPMRERTAKLRAQRGEEIQVEGRKRPIKGATEAVVERRKRDRTDDDLPRLRRLFVNCTPGSQAGIPPFGLLDVPAVASDTDGWARHLVGHLERRPGRFAGVFQVVDAWSFVEFVRAAAPSADPKLAPREPQKVELDTLWMADNSQLQAESAGLAYRYSAELGDTDGRHILRWGSKEWGIATEDGEWLRVSGRKWGRRQDQYLPLRSNGLPVLVQCQDARQQNETKAAASANEAAAAAAQEWALRGEELEVQRAVLKSLRPGGSYTLVVADAGLLGWEPWDPRDKDWMEAMAVSKRREQLLAEHLERRATEIAEEVGNGGVDVRVVLADKNKDGYGTGALWTRLWSCVR